MAGSGESRLRGTRRQSLGLRRRVGRLDARTPLRPRPLPRAAPARACRELRRRYIPLSGPARSGGFARWGGISGRSATDAFASLGASLLPVRSPVGDDWLLADDEPAIRAGETAAAPARLL